MILLDSGTFLFMSFVLIAGRNAFTSRESDSDSPYAVKVGKSDGKEPISRGMGSNV